MEKTNSVRNIGIKLPVGVRFNPTDEELVVHYLRPKVFSFPLPSSVIPELDVFHINPWDLPGKSGERKYFFCKTKENENKLGPGFWKAIGENHVLTSQSNQVIGVKKSLVFCHRTQHPGGLRTCWFMDEYHLLGTQPTNNASSNSGQKLMTETEDWVVCCIYPNKVKHESERQVISPPQATLSCSSGITQVSSNASDQEETSSYTRMSFLN